MPSNIDKLVEKLGLIPHPEGGYFKETYRSKDVVKPTDKRYKGEERKASTAIYYLLGGEDFSSFHQVNSDELWQYCSGSPLTLYVIDKNSHKLKEIQIGDPLQHENANYQYCIEEGQWFAAKPNDSSNYTLITCTVSPGFEFSDWLAAERANLAEQFPQHVAKIEQFTRTGEAKTEEDAKLETAKKAIGRVAYQDDASNL